MMWGSPVSSWGKDAHCDALTNHCTYALRTLLRLYPSMHARHARSSLILATNQQPCMLIIHPFVGLTTKSP
jgi:hypothetical protein